MVPIGGMILLWLCVCPGVSLVNCSTRCTWPGESRCLCTSSRRLFWNLCAASKSLLAWIFLLMSCCFLLLSFSFFFILSCSTHIYPQEKKFKKVHLYYHGGQIKPQILSFITLWKRISFFVSVWCCVCVFQKAQFIVSFIRKSLQSVQAHPFQSPTDSSQSPQLKDSGNGFAQEEVGVFFPAQHSVHFKGVGWRVRMGHHALAKFAERSLCHQLHPHWSDAAFDTERLVDGRVLLEAHVQLEKKEKETQEGNEEIPESRRWCVLLLFYYLVSLFLSEVSHAFELQEDLVMRIWASDWISYKRFFYET